MRRYLQSRIDNRLHLGSPLYDSDGGDFEPPSHTLCGLPSTTWSDDYVQALTWARVAPDAVCRMCDRTALWESISSLEEK
jgi:hypothetical protein